MKIGFITDNFSVKNGTGIARYSLELFKSIKDPEYDMIPISPKVPKMPMKDFVRHTINVPYFVIKHKSEFNILHATTPENGVSFPFVKIPSIVTYHDLSPIIYKDLSKSYVKFLAPLYYRVGHYTDRVMTISSQTKAELIEYLKIPGDKIAVINPGINDDLKSDDYNKYNNTLIIGYLGVYSKRKRLDFLLKTIYFLKNNFPHLKIEARLYGKRKDKFYKEYLELRELATFLGISDVVKFEDPVDDDEINTIYNSFNVFVFPSDYEGFGIPIIEAQRCKVPVVIREEAKIPCEVKKYCFKAKDEKDMAKLINKIFNYNRETQNTIEDAYRYSKTFTWKKAAKETIKLYEYIINI